MAVGHVDMQDVGMGADPREIVGKVDEGGRPGRELADEAPGRQVVDPGRGRHGHRMRSSGMFVGACQIGADER